MSSDTDPVLGFTVGGVEKTAVNLQLLATLLNSKLLQPVFYGDNYDSSDGIVNMDSQILTWTRRRNLQLQSRDIQR